MRSFLSSTALLLLLALTACESDQRPPALNLPVSAGGSSGQTPNGVPECEPFPAADTSGSCGAETVDLQQRKPTIYFLLDVSGSMNWNVADSSTSKIKAARTALTSVVKDIGHQILYGLATFPGPAQDGEPVDYPYGCEPGEEVFSVTEGDAKECMNLPATGDNYRAFSRVVADLEADGGTPLSPTLATLAPKLVGNEGQVAVVLVTDGSPNCNPQASCEAEDCGLTGQYLSDGTVCDEENNCCSEDFADTIFLPQSNCTDGPTSVEQVEQLQQAGVDTYVIGVLGDEDFDDIMNALAEAGGQAREGERKYFDVSSLDELTDVVRRIGSAVAQNCTLELKERPEFANTLNVYFDGEVVPLDSDNGWSFETDDVVQLHGDACETWTSGSVDKIEFVSGCETIIR